MYKENLIREAINKDFSLSLKKPSVKYLQFDAYDENYIIEIKARKTFYEKQIIEFSKFSFNSYYAKLNAKKFIYAVYINGDIYIFNISDLEKNNYNFKWEWREQPSTTDFENKDKIQKFVGYISLKDNVKKISNSILW